MNSFVFAIRRSLCWGWRIAIFTFAVEAGAAAEVTIDWKKPQGQESKAIVEVHGLSAEELARLDDPARTVDAWQALLAVRVDQADVRSAAITPPMVGVYTVEDRVLTFTPAFPLQPGLSYRAVYRNPAARDAKPLVARHTVRKKAAVPITRVTEVYPTSERLPENLLKFYVHFSAPMSRGQIYEHIHLFDPKGAEVDIPFLEIDEELWDPAMRRVTLFIDPGRIKRGVRPLEEVGPALEAGKDYRLVIDSTWQDGEGQPLVEGFEKSFRVVPPDRRAPDPSSWKVTEEPKAGGRGALTVRFLESLDHALAKRLIVVVNGAGETVPGEVTMGDGERSWSFVPEARWSAGDYQLRVATIIEDLAGNQVGKVFEVDVFEEIDDASLPKTRWVEVPFEVRP